MNSIKLWIDNQEVEAEPSLTIMEAAEQAGVHIPRLCYHPSLKPSGACRLCAVEIEGYRGLPAACSTPVAHGMKVETETPKVADFRREMLRLILQEHPRECLGCPRNGTCELQRLVDSVGIDFPYSPPNGKRAAVQPAGAYFERYMSLCVRCGRCVRVCHEVRGTKAIVFREVAGRQEVGTAFGLSLEEAGCQFCGACVDVCPVGALREKPARTSEEERNQMLDACEGLASIVTDLYRREMPTHWKSSTCPICSAGCRMSFELSESNEILQVRPDRNGIHSHGQSCVQGRFLLRKYIQSPARLTKPLVLENGRYREAEWETVVEDLAKKLQNYGPWETALLTDAGPTTEELFLLQKFARTALKTNLIGCISPPGHAAAEELLSRRSNSATLRGNLRDLSKAGAVLAIGVNPPASHPIAGTYVREAALNGTKLIVANPLSGGITHYADANLHYRPGSESALIAGLMHLLLDGNMADSVVTAQSPLAIHTMKNDLAEYHPEEVAKVTGVNAESLQKAASLIGGGKPLTILYGPGLIQSPDAVESLKAMIALLHLTGSVARLGGGMIPLYGKGNLHGASDLGLVSQLYATPNPSAVDCGDRPGDIRDLFASTQVKAVYLACETYGSGIFDSLRPLLEKMELVILHDTVLPASAAQGSTPLAQVILPMASALEKSGSFTDFYWKAAKIAPVVPPPGEAKSVLWLLQELARCMKVPGFSPKDEEDLHSEIWKEIAASTTLVKKAPKATSCCCCQKPAKSGSECEEDFPAWKPAQIKAPRALANKEFPFAAVAGEDLDPYFAGPLLAEEAKALFYANGDIEMNPADAFAIGLTPGDTVRIVTDVGEELEGRLSLNGLLPPKTLAISMASLKAWGKARSAAERNIPVRVANTDASSE